MNALMSFSVGRRGRRILVTKAGSSAFGSREAEILSTSQFQRPITHPFQQINHNEELILRPCTLCASSRSHCFIRINRQHNNIHPINRNILFPNNHSRRSRLQPIDPLRRAPLLRAPRPLPLLQTPPSRNLRPRDFKLEIFHVDNVRRKLCKGVLADVSPVARCAGRCDRGYV